MTRPPAELPASAPWGRKLESQLQTSIVGHPLLAFDEVGSTNDVAKDLGERGVAEGLAVIARAQTRGRGRRGRVWESRPGEGVYLSVLLRPALPDGDAGWLAIMAGVAALRALEGIGVAGLSLKWPNDVLANRKKIAGVLVEPRVSARSVDFAVIGIGVNVAQASDAWSESLKQAATSCHIEGVEVACDDVAVRLLQALEEWYACLRARDDARLMGAWVERGGTSTMPEIA